MKLYVKRSFDAYGSYYNYYDFDLGQGCFAEDEYQKPTNYERYNYSFLLFLLVHSRNNYTLIEFTTQQIENADNPNV